MNIHPHRLAAAIAFVCVTSSLAAQSANSNAKGNSSAASNTKAGSAATPAGTTTGSTTTPTPAAASATTPANASSAAPAAATSTRASAKFDLPRLKTNARSGVAGTVAKEHATVHALEAGARGNARARAKQNVDYVEVDPRSSWSSPIRGAAKDTTFVSYFVCASEGTSINVAGAHLLMRPAAQPGYLQMQVGRATAKGMQWRNFGGPVKVEKYDGAALAALPVLTARLDPVAGIWDLYVGERLGAADLALKALPAGATRQFTVHAGAEGALVCGLISSDDNPLHEDANRNGIDDAFEKSANNGHLLTAPGVARSRLAQSWQQDQQGRQSQLPPWAVRRPLPDAVAGKAGGR